MVGETVWRLHTRLSACLLLDTSSGLDDCNPLSFTFEDNRDHHVLRLHQGDSKWGHDFALPRADNSMHFSLITQKN
uniref:WGS project CBMI000000000 data, contig CS3069_c004859 n=1 Tax=Fusarium clavum TaxID=2594811 RepID=A0A090MEZ1_9HYPO|nr:unnamed protein product [Fusarium clavum]